MRTEKQRARHVGRYLSLARFEVDRFLSRACCHNHALAIWRSWQPVEIHVLPFTEEGRLPEGGVIMSGVLELIGAAGSLADIVERELDDETAVNGWALDDIAEKIGGGDLDKIMHAFVRVPLLAPGARGHSTKNPNDQPAVNIWLTAKGEH